MTSSACFLRVPAWHRPVHALLACVLLLGALFTPWGLLSSHGVAELPALQHHAATDADHGHTHEDGAEEVTPGFAHPHHAADHSHDTAHALPQPLRLAAAAAPAWHGQRLNPPPAPPATRLERPPRG